MDPLSIACWFPVVAFLSQSEGLLATELESFRFVKGLS
jgi:hypothetical protein